jgi:hypothetical protein
VSFASSKSRVTRTACPHLRDRGTSACRGWMRVEVFRSVGIPRFRRRTFFSASYFCCRYILPALRCDCSCLGAWLVRPLESKRRRKFSPPKRLRGAWDSAGIPSPTSKDADACFRNDDVYGILLACLWSPSTHFPAPWLASCGRAESGNSQKPSSPHGTRASTARGHLIRGERPMRDHR